MEQATTQASKFYSAVVDGDSYTGDKEQLFENLVFQAMEQVKATRGPCDVCDSTEHTGATCPHRGKAFQADWLQKRVAQKNLVDGDTPKVPIPQKSPPPRASFSKFKPQFKTMSLSDPDAIRSELDTIQEALEQDTSTDDDLWFASMNESTAEDGSFMDHQVHFH